MNAKEFLIISKIADYILDKIYNNISEGKEDFVRENDIMKYFLFLNGLQPSQEEINMAIYKVNCHYSNPVLKCRKEIISESVNLERAFYLSTNNLNEIEEVCRNLMKSNKLYPTNRQRSNDEEIPCLVLTTQKKDIFLLTQLRIGNTPQMLIDLGVDEMETYSEDPNYFYVFNSMFSNFKIDTKIYLDIYEMSSLKVNDKTIRYPKEHFDFIDLEELKSYNFN